MGHNNLCLCNLLHHSSVCEYDLVFLILSFHTEVAVCTIPKPMRLKSYFLASFGLLAPYLERACLLLATPAVSSVPRTIW